jgi:hypothetical protein
MIRINGQIHLTDADVATIRAAGVALYVARPDSTTDLLRDVVTCSQGHEHEVTIQRVGDDDWLYTDRQ